MKKHKVLNIIRWTLSAIVMPVRTILSLIMTLIFKKVARKVLNRYDLNMDNVIWYQKWKDFISGPFTFSHKIHCA